MLLGIWSGASAQAVPVEIAIVSRTVFYVPLWVAAERGFLERQGIEPRIEVHNNAENINDGLRSGEVQISISTPESVVADAYGGGSLRLIGGNAGKLPHFIIARPGIETLAQLRGAKFGVLSLEEGTAHLVGHLARVAGLEQHEYEIVAVGGAPTRWALLKAGDIDAGLQPFPLSYEADAAGFSNLGPISDYIPDYQFTSVNVDANWARDNRRTVIAFLRALKQGHDYMMANRLEAAEIAARELGTSVALARRALDDTVRLDILSGDLSVSEPGLAYVFDLLQSTGAIAAERPFDLTRIVDESYLAEAVAGR